MRTHTRLKMIAGLSLVAMTLGLVARPVLAAQKAPKPPVPPIEAVRKQLLKLPYYGVFDFLSYKYDDNGTVTLMGYSYRGSLKGDAERAVKRVPEVTAVVNKIDDLSPSSMDDELRWKIYFRIYDDPFLSRYAPGGGLLWGHRHAFRGRTFFPLGPSRFPGTEPAGDYPIHIIVDKGRVTLLGVVDNESDKTVAGMKAREVPGSFAVTNDLMVDNPSTKEKKTT
jgi:hyperosmotically inducible periplasmic protein